MSTTVSLAALLTDRARLLANVANDEIPLTYLQILPRLEGGVTRAAELARRTGISRQAIGQTIEQMQTEGLVTRKADPDNQRAFVIKTTAKGRRRYQRALSASQRAEDRLAEQIGAPAVRALRKALERDWSALGQ